jgi:radical SAM superfamily enzyme YgiQ (UPF0313 family)
MKVRMNVLLISTYELGRQSFSVASAAAMLKREGATVSTQDLAIERLDADLVATAEIVCFSVPMHTATRIAVRLAERVKSLNPDAHLCFFGLYAPVNEALLRRIGAGTVLGGEFESGMVSMYRRLTKERPNAKQSEPVISLERQEFLVPDRSGLPPLGKYATLTLPDGSVKTVGYTEATRGCKHLCRHCPVVPVYGGTFRAVPRDIVLQDIEQQVRAGTQHITFGDPDFFNGPGHALRIVEAMHEAWPHLTYDATIKIEHLVRRLDLIPRLRDTGCILVTSAVEAVDDAILEILDKQHTRAEFELVVQTFRKHGLALNPTFVTFTPWTSLCRYRELLEVIAELELVESVTPIQYAIRLLIPYGSRLLELPETRRFIGDFDPVALVYPWTHPDPAMDRLHETVLAIVERAQGLGESRRQIFDRIWNATQEAMGEQVPPPRTFLQNGFGMPSVPALSEPWYC